MPINTVSLITGTLSFSAALAWNKAINDSLNSYIRTPSPILQAVIVTIIIILIVFFINTGLKLYTSFTSESLKNSIINAGGHNESKVKLWNK